jgi:hypothetical protein
MKRAREGYPQKVDEKGRGEQSGVSVAPFFRNAHRQTYNYTQKHYYIANRGERERELAIEDTKKKKKKGTSCESIDVFSAEEKGLVTVEKKKEHHLSGVSGRGALQVFYCHTRTRAHKQTHTHTQHEGDHRSIGAEKAGRQANTHTTNSNDNNNKSKDKKA